MHDEALDEARPTPWLNRSRTPQGWTNGRATLQEGRTHPWQRCAGLPGSSDAIHGLHKINIIVRTVDALHVYLLR